MAHLDYVLHLADSAIVLGQRNAEWCGHGPILEEDIAMANNSLDLIGQARMLYQYAATLKNDGSTEDSLAYFRSAQEFKNYTILELPHHGPLVGYAVDNRDYAVTIVRNFLYSAIMALIWEKLQTSRDEQLAAIATKSLKEVRYHLRHSHDWLVRFGDGTEDSHARAQAALNHLMPYTQEFWTFSDFESSASKSGVGINATQLKEDWESIVHHALKEAKLDMPSTDGFVTTGKLGAHSEHLGFLLDEMQSLARAHPEGVW
ncbi:1,2-phenylacetyl-CoA epoxidase subunit PaaC [Limnohabitans sp.]|uniref:1,2-phenylacetyl-CoA epoxidase subunit PaaC n=1 Tax=Limnohabitans sp. TaxID=1907725 RepID=UPI003341C52B